MSTQSPQHHLSPIQASTGALSSDWKEMHDPKTGRKYWVNHSTKQMSYNPPTATKSPESVAAETSKAGLGVSFMTLFFQL